MSKVWSGSDEEAPFGDRGGKPSARERRSKYQKKELELAEEREALSRLLGDERQRKEEVARIRRDRERKETEMLQLEQRQRDRERALQELEHRVAGQKAKVSRLERDVNSLREEAFQRSR